MRNLKKILALVLALVMSLSLVTMANADYADQADIDNAEAVAVMSAIGVLQGSDGKFDPDGILTREQAAKIITYILLGKDKADKLTTLIAPFADVAANRWSAGAIAYCADQGILDGVGGGLFNPTGKLTGLQFAKMVLCAMGYDAAIEGLTGDTWAIKTATLAVDLGLDKNIDVDLSAEMSRENAAQMAFNALELPMVKYEGGTTVELPGGTKVVVGAVQKPAGKKLIDKYTDKLEKDDSVDEPDAFGRPAAYEWEYDGEVIYTAAAELTKSYAGDVKANDVWKDLGKFDGTISATVKANGASAASVDVKKDAAGTFGGTNTAVEVYYDKDAKTITVVEIAYTLGKVTDVKADTVDKYGDVTKKAYVTIAGKEYETTAFAKDDVVLYALVGSAIKDVKLADSFTGKVTAKKGTDVTIGGTVYADAYGLAVGAEGTFWQGVCGTIIDAEATKTTSDKWAYVYNVKANSEDDTVNEDGFTVAGGSSKTAYVVLADGTKASYVIDADDATAMAWTAGNVVCYEINSDGEIKAATKGDTDITAKASVDFGKGAAVVSGKYTNADTKFVFSYVKSEAGKADVQEVKVVTGYKNVVADKQNAVVVFDTESGKALTVFVLADAKAEVSETKDYYILMDAAYTETVDAEDKPVYTYDVFVNGEATTLSSGKKVFEGKTAGQIFTVKLTDGKVAETTDVTYVTAKAGTVSALVDDYAVLTGTDAGTYYFTADAQTYLEKTEDGVYSVSKDALAKDDVLRFITVSGGDDDGKICFALITRAE